jgi:hypothetical protein
VASKSTNSTLWTVAWIGALAVGVLVLYKKFAGGKSSGSTGTVSGAGGYPDYYAPDQQQQNPLSGIGSLLSSLLSLVGRGSSGGGGGAKLTPGGGSSSSSGSSDPLTNLFNVITNADQLDAANTDYSGTSVANYSYDQGLPASAFTIPYEDAGAMLDNPGTFITSSSDGSANAVSGFDNQLIQTQGNSLDGIDISSSQDPSIYGDGSGDYFGD